jgi:hypothetical protein
MPTIATLPTVATLAMADSIASKVPTFFTIGTSAADGYTDLRAGRRASATAECVITGAYAALYGDTPSDRAAGLIAMARARSVESSAPVDYLTYVTRHPERHVLMLREAQAHGRALGVWSGSVARAARRWC